MSFRAICLSIYVVALTVCTSAATALTQGELVEREFMILMPAGATEADCPAFLDPNSLLLVAHAQPGDAETRVFWAGTNPDSPLPLSGTEWVGGDTAVTHAAVGGSKQYKVLWRNSRAPNGARADTGGEFGALITDIYMIRRVTTTEDSLASDDDWRVTSVGDDNRLVCVGVGWFTK